MPGKHTCKSSCSAKIALIFPKAVFALLACWILLSRECMGSAKQAGIYLSGWETGFGGNRLRNSTRHKCHITDIESYVQHKHQSYHTERQPVE